MTAVPLERFRFLEGEGAVRWFKSSNHAERGFCRTCGSSLFWRPADGTRMSVAAGAIDPPTGLSIAHHIFVAEQSDYYDIRDDAPCHDAGGDFSPLPRGE
jgi:hypothetical protein